MQLKKRIDSGCMTNPKLKALFLDRDGVINIDHGYVGALDSLEIYSDVYQSLRIAKDLGFMLFVITNQSGVARGYFDLAAVNEIHNSIDKRLKATAGVSIDHYFICPHHPSGNVEPFNTTCNCRKPKTGLINQAIAMYPNLDLSESFLVGDKPSDIECGIKAGLRSIQILRGQYANHEKPWATAKNLEEAIILIKEN